MISSDEPLYLISVISKMLDIHPQTLRQYEREGLVIPSRTEGRIRLYSANDIEKIKFILKLTRDLGVNIAGVDIILQLKCRIDELECDVDKLKDKLDKISDNRTIPTNRSVVKKRGVYDIVIVKNSE